MLVMIIDISKACIAGCRHFVSPKNVCSELSWRTRKRPYSLSQQLITLLLYTWMCENFSAIFSCSLSYHFMHGWTFCIVYVVCTADIIHESSCHRNQYSFSVSSKYLLDTPNTQLWTRYFNNVWEWWYQVCIWSRAGGNLGGSSGLSVGCCVLPISTMELNSIFPGQHVSKIVNFSTVSPALVPNTAQNQ